MEKLSAVLIVKNEEVMLGKCLQSIEWVDEIIICDTGSKDKTIEIAGKYTDKIFFFDWCDDFSKARNYAKSFAIWEYILSIDADEELQPWWIEKIRKSIESWADWIYMNLFDWFSNRFSNIRCFKREKDWVWAIHESVLGITSKTYCEAEILYKHSPAHELDEDLDFRILKNEYEKNPKNTRTIFYLAREYYYKKEYDTAIRLYNEYLSLKSTHYSEVTDAYYRLALCYWYDWEWHWELSRECLMKAIVRNVNFKAAHKLMAEQMIDEKKKATWLKFAEIADNSNLLFTH